MTAVVLYESSAARLVAEAVAEGLRAHGPVRCEEVSTWAARPGARNVPRDLDLLVVGVPVQEVSLGLLTSRRGIPAGMRAYLADMIMPTGGVRVATFEVKTPRASVAAGKTAEKRLVGLGGRPVTPVRTFRVDVRGVPDDGELQAAQAWGAGLVAPTKVR